MGGQEEDPQRLKRIAAAAYDYDNDSRWPEYWSNILIPPHMASRSDVIDHYKRKFYQRYIDPDLVVEAMASSSSSQSARPTPTPSSSSTPNEQVRSRNSGSTTRTSSTTAASTPTSLRWDRQTIQFSINAWVFIVAVLAIIPLVPRNLSNRAYRLSFMGTACSSLFSLYSLYGVTVPVRVIFDSLLILSYNGNTLLFKSTYHRLQKPRAWNLQAVQVWFQSVIATKDFVYFIYCLTFVTSNLYLKFALIPILCRALEYVAKFLRRNFTRSSLYRWEISNLLLKGIYYFFFYSFNC
ncbi:hypothetical protein CsSME_00005341 [Camellia sinensis var. sinensis]